jgi:radical SAM protein with 4Fe4S-binding SPASM domain
MLTLKSDRVKLENKNGVPYLLDAHMHLAFALNDSSEIICKDLLEKRSPLDIATHLTDVFDGITLDEALQETVGFMDSLKEGELIEEENSNLLQKGTPPLTNVTFSITNRCNLRCMHCLAGSTLGRTDEFPLSKIAELIEELKGLGCKSVSLFGGEPLVRKDIWEIVHLFQAARIGVKINTNATLMTPEFAKRAKAEKIILFTVSLDGSAAKVQDPFRGQGSWTRNIRGIEALVEAGNSVYLSTTVTKFNFKDVPDIARLAKKLNVTKARFNDVHYGGNAACFSDAIRLTPPEKFQALENLKIALDELGGFVIGSTTDQYEIIKNANDENIPSFPLVINACGASMGSACLRADGVVTPCEILWDTVCGSVWEKTFAEIYNSAPDMVAFRRPLILTETDIPDCVGCKYLNACYKGHRCSPYFNPGSLLKDQARFNCWVR